MSQAYYTPQRVMSPVQEAASFSMIGGGHHQRAEDVQEAYVETRETLVNAIDETSSILTELRAFNNDEWVVRYPQIKEEKDTKEGKSLRRSISFVDEPDLILEEKQHKLARSASVSSFSDDETVVAEEDNSKSELLPGNFNVLRLDLRVDPHSSSSLVSQLGKASIASLLSGRIGSTLSHLNSLRTRVEDTESKVLVTGDLNAGKSTFVNALLRREVMPVDQQPCTKGFWEVRDAQETNGVEEVHLVGANTKYDIKDASTYTRRSIDELDQVLREIDEEEGDDDDDTPAEQKPQRIIKLYLSSPSALFPPSVDGTTEEKNPLSISLIDAPGLNTSSLSTSLLFSLQPSIDVIVFLISASNHFTLSSKEFLFSASQEKAHIFVVVNKFKEIKDKDRCIKRVLDQIKVLSPKTYEERDELVHFVDSSDALVPGNATPSFDDLEDSLKSFVFMKRSKSKFLPAKNYLMNILSDIELLARANALVAKNERLRAQADLDRAKPVYEGMMKGRQDLDDNLAVVEDSFTSIAERSTKNTLTEALDAIARGELPKGLKDTSLPPYPGLFGIFDFARDMRKTFLKGLDESVKVAEDNVRRMTSEGVEEVKGLAEAHLPPDVPRSKRVFMPEAMFRAHPNASGRRSSRATSNSSIHSKSSRRNSSVVVAGGVHGLGIGMVTPLNGPLSQSEELREGGGLGDIFDLYYHLSNLSKSSSDGKEYDIDEDEETSTALSILSLTGAASISLTMLGSQALGARSLLHTVLKLGDLVSNEESRKWLAPMLAVGTLGLGVWVVLELPQTIPRTVGRRVRRDLVRVYGENRLVRNNRTKKNGAKDLEEGAEEEVLTFPTYHSHRISSETRKVLRLASWDLRERFRSSLEERAKEVKSLEEGVRRAVRAEGYFAGGEGKSEGVVGKVRVVRSGVQAVAMAGEN